MNLPTTEQLANEFSRLLAEEIGLEGLSHAVNLNRTPLYDGGCCASHDFCDANVVMAEAFKSLTGVEPDRTNPALDGIYMPGMSDDAGKLWAEAWALAKKSEFRRVQGNLRQYKAHIVKNGRRLGSEYVDWFTDDDDAGASYRAIMSQQGYKVKSVTIGYPCIVELE